MGPRSPALVDNQAKSCGHGIVPARPCTRLPRQRHEPHRTTTILQRPRRPSSGPPPTNCAPPGRLSPTKQRGCWADLFEIRLLAHFQKNGQNELARPVPRQTPSTTTTPDHRQEMARRGQTQQSTKRTLPPRLRCRSLHREKRLLDPSWRHAGKPCADSAQIPLRQTSTLPWTARQGRPECNRAPWAGSSTTPWAVRACQNQTKAISTEGFTHPDRRLHYGRPRSPTSLSTNFNGHTFGGQVR